VSAETSTLRVLSADGRTETVRLDKSPMVVGRARECDLSFPDDASLSRKHLTIAKEGDGWAVEDLGSKNGTRVGGTPVTERRRLRPGDRIAAGHLSLIFDPDKAPARPAVEFHAEGGPILGAPGTMMTSLEGVLLDPSTPRRISAQASKAPGVTGEGSIPSADPFVAALIRAGRELAGRRPLEELFPLILDLAISAVGADRGVLLTIEGDDLQPRALRGQGFRISRAVRDHVLNERASLLVRDAASDEMFRNRESIIASNVRTIMAAPLQTDERVIGLLYVDSPMFARPFTREDLNLLTVMANVAAIRIEHERLAEVEAAERLMSRDLAQAAEIQRMLLGGSLPEQTGLDLAAESIPCHAVGGDYYEFFTREDGRVTIVLGDVSGKGMPAALLMSRLQAKVQLLIDEPLPIETAMDRLDRAVAARAPSNRFVSLVWADCNPMSGAVAWCNAGHNPPLLVRAAGGVERLEASGLPLGLVPGRGYREEQLTLEKGDLLAIFSDGLVEAQNDAQEEFGEARLGALLAESRSLPSEGVVAGALTRIAGWTGGRPAADDLTLAVIRRPL